MKEVESFIDRMQLQLGLYSYVVFLQEVKWLFNYILN